MAEFDVIRAYSLKLPLAIALPLEYNWRLSGRDFPHISITLRKVIAALMRPRLFLAFALRWLGEALKMYSAAARPGSHQLSS